MKLPCPYCTEKITYDINLAGKTVKCSYCQKNILMTPLEKLPPEHQQEYKDEQEKIRKKQEVEERRLEEKRRKELERQDAERKRQQEIQVGLVRQREKELKKQLEKNYVGDKPQNAKHLNISSTTLIVIGLFLIFLGVIGLANSFNMKTTVETSGEYSWQKNEVHNIGLIADRHDYIILSALSVVVGVIILCFGILIKNIPDIEETTNKSLKSLQKSLKPIGHPPQNINPPPITDDMNEDAVKLSEFLDKSRKRIEYPHQDTNPAPITNDMNEDAALSYLAPPQDLNSPPNTNDNIRKDSNEIIPPPIQQI